MSVVVRAGIFHSPLMTVAMLAAFAPPIACAETLPDALVRAYQSNPQLNAERANLRSTDEGVPQALSGYRPQVTVGLSAGLISLRNLLPDGTGPGRFPPGSYRFRISGPAGS